ncbi:type II toxin-antitoxin system RelE/ParE family toxin [archaeon]|jgi:addiction module RelE/StbE family toxin|nr:type II toxin-antitoxin system RelE/ParE family toxin [archaeon]MBT4397825.1 type II toxin-antitoxin system RelE/ParE family toxin [archaeon]MBT4441159.1 type II toxin-antitoxin system RelE/ParE family toxin [archaeon]
MVIVAFEENFKKKISKLKDKTIKEKIIKQITKIKNNPNIGKPMKFSRKGTREIYISPFRLVYKYVEEKVIIIDIYHKDDQ